MWQAYKEIAKHWKMLYNISRFNSKKGVTLWKLLQGARYLGNAKKHFRYLKKCDKELLLKSEAATVSL